MLQCPRQGAARPWKVALPLVVNPEFHHPPLLLSPAGSQGPVPSFQLLPELVAEPVLGTDSSSLLIAHKTQQSFDFCVLQDLADGFLFDGRLQLLQLLIKSCLCFQHSLRIRRADLEPAFYTLHSLQGVGGANIKLVEDSTGCALRAPEAAAWVRSWRPFGTRGAALAAAVELLGAFQRLFPLFGGLQEHIFWKIRNADLVPGRDVPSCSKDVEPIVPLAPDSIGTARMRHKRGGEVG
mmetsp:Transcript_74218/g.133795  ORF Transcript_74218/g.133795 Transcript_74218/m.133795 type:complete len:238 (+) Transcript_74218:316-1029(+)